MNTVRTLKKSAQNGKKRTRKWLRILIWIVSILFIIGIAAALFLALWPAFGAAASGKDREDYKSRADNFDGERFSNEHEFHMMEKVPDNAADGVISSKGTKPEEILKAATPDFKKIRSAEDVTVTWFGHSTLFIQMHGMNILIDPIFSERSSPVGFAGNKRFSELPAQIQELPEIDIMVLSHDHYDHLDYQTICKLDQKVKQYVVPLGVENSLERWHVAEDKITNMAWWEEIQINGLTIGCTPARHYSGRSVNDRFKSLWASWVFIDENHKLYESGDTGFDAHFKEIQEKYGDFDFVLMDGAQYNLRWPSVHMNPEESYKAMQILGAEYAMPIHWGTFRLANHPWDDSVQRIVKAAEGGDITIVTPRIGETVDIGNLSDYQGRWYEQIP